MSLEGQKIDATKLWIPVTALLAIAAPLAYQASFNARMQEKMDNLTERVASIDQKLDRILFNDSVSFSQ